MVHFLNNNMKKSINTNCNTNYRLKYFKYKQKYLALQRNL
jgi:hypothetical protein